MRLTAASICRHAVVPLLLAIACTKIRPDHADITLRADLAAVAGVRIYFGHQSVGRDILDGIREIQQQSSHVRIDFRTLADAPASGPAFVEAVIGRNADPGSKCVDFSQHLNRLAGSVNIALMKFCYVDFDSRTRPVEVFAEYRRTIERIKARYPRLVIVHATAPLTRIPPVWKLTLKDWLRLSDESATANLKRSEFNELLRRTYIGEPLFDLAAVESELGDGRRNAFTFRGISGFGLVDDYAADAGHLNRAGRQRAACELIRTLAHAARVIHRS